jgi:adenosylcobinamide-GDP ribazoletransferase
VIRRFACALAFLTRAPLPSRLVFDARDVGRATLMFPAIGGLFGGIAIGLHHLLAGALPSPVTALLIVAACALASGALHLDGLADMADGFGGGRTRDDVLRIMRDHVIGAYGGCALVLVIGLKVAAIAALLDRRADAALLLAPVLARWASVPVGWLAPYARPQGGLGQAITDHVGPAEVAGATALAGGAVLVAGWPGAPCWLAVAALSAAQAWWCVRKIGGVTGDTLGANVEVCEAAVYVLALGLA